MDHTDFYYPRIGDFVTNAQGTVYKVIKINRVNTVCQDRAGKLWNVRGTLKKYDGDPGWETAEIKPVKPGTVFTVKADSGLFRKQWFRQFTTDQLFVAIGGDALKVNFVPLGGYGMPETTRNYSTTPDSVEVRQVPTKNYDR